MFHDIEKMTTTGLCVLRIENALFTNRRVSIYTHLLFNVTLPSLKTWQCQFARTTKDPDNFVALMASGFARVLVFAPTTCCPKI